MYGNSQKKYKNIAFQILKIYKAFSNFDFNSTIFKMVYIDVNQMLISFE